MRRVLLWAGVLACALHGSAHAADNIVAPAPLSAILPVAEPQPPGEAQQRVGYEVRLGGYAHGLGSVERNTVAFSVDLATPRLLSTQGWWEFLVPRAYVGGMINAQGRTSSAHAGALWLFAITSRVFAEGFFGGAVHDGSINGDATHAALGSRVLFHAGGSLGFRFDRNWSAMLTFDHLSNGNRVFGTGFVRNQGINSYGAKLAFAF